MDQVKELQIKLGYARETVRLYYPLTSLEVLLGVSSCWMQDGIIPEGCPAEQGEAQALLEKLRENPTLQDSSLGKIGFSRRGDRFEVNIPPEGTEYVHHHVVASAFLVDLIDLFQKHHHCEMADIQTVFTRHGSCVCEKMPEGTDFDYVMYFEDPAVDEYYYCIKMEMGHTIYHRFMREDSEALL